ncbi:hypothetical protein HPB52_022932 [Rhipicephalus sanguineus]|uniref:Reverse transcriptase domain-containing protein n=1 Tax=Rhipicephalus sanguineus TaxID=34632 RepID=A0A9D4T231_RHISA|nr:hypothetical protein HPB52_022932 [Rhipicephalus sanguineus]
MVVLQQAGSLGRHPNESSEGRRDNGQGGLGGHMTASVKIKCGLRQGCPLSPLLFMLYIVGVSQKLESSGCGYSLRHKEQGRAVTTRVPALIYADDIALLAHSPDELQALLDICGDTMATLHLRFNPQKCGVMGDVKVAVPAVSTRQLVRQQEREEWVRTAEKKSSMTVYMIGKGDIAKEAFFDNSRGSGLLAEARSGVRRTRHWRAHYVDGQQTQCILCNAAEETIEHIVLQCPKIHLPSETTSLQRTDGTRLCRGRRPA